MNDPLPDYPDDDDKPTIKPLGEIDSAWSRLHKEFTYDDDYPPSPEVEARQYAELEQYWKAEAEARTTAKFLSPRGTGPDPHPWLSMR